jgi:hypothetical protein
LTATLSKLHAADTLSTRMSLHNTNRDIAHMNARVYVLLVMELKHVQKLQALANSSCGELKQRHSIKQSEYPHNTQRRDIHATWSRQHPPKSTSSSTVGVAGRPLPCAVLPHPSRALLLPEPHVPLCIMQPGVLSCNISPLECNNQGMLQQMEGQ